MTEFGLMTHPHFFWYSYGIILSRGYAHKIGILLCSPRAIIISPILGCVAANRLA